MPESVLILIDKQFASIEKQLEKYEELEIDSGDGKLTIETPDGSKFILSRQSATEQIWLAEPLNGWRFNLVEKQGEQRWISEKEKKDLLLFLNELLSSRLGQTITLQS
ncbi:MAG: iron donor protein CyaY [Chloroherpetonaceae bacterium]|nr:iron donor protein CyaY [Chloroherpetonaceae bacterium]